MAEERKLTVLARPGVGRKSKWKGLVVCQGEVARLRERSRGEKALEASSRPCADTPPSKAAIGFRTRSWGKTGLGGKRRETKLAAKS